ncbi:mitotic spindle assembly checkpoint protein MAD2A [Periplaneta americana]|uniref:mitotic spindle assembly checkpoint protein MAD2A n=1 Tax=Periplaneta americana TaxID=6978 RepID=UPI0037E875C6
MASTHQQTKSSITLKGSSELVKDYLDYGINSILYQRGIYPAETFIQEEHFGLTIFMSTNLEIKSFLNSVLQQIKEWLVQKKMQKISLVISNSNTKEVLERWDFNVEYEGAGNAVENGVEVGKKDLAIIQKEIRDVLRQISGTISFLPLLDCKCTFDLLVYTIPDCEIPQEWDETQPCFMANSQELQLRTFSTSLHKMRTCVSYKVE